MPPSGVGWNQRMKNYAPSGIRIMPPSDIVSTQAQGAPQDNNDELSPSLCSHLDSGEHNLKRVFISRKIKLLHLYDMLQCQMISEMTTRKMCMK